MGLLQGKKTPKNYLTSKACQRLGVKLYAVSIFGVYVFCKVYDLSGKPNEKLNGYFNVNDLFYLHDSRPYINPKTKKPQ